METASMPCLLASWAHAFNGYTFKTLGILWLLALSLLPAHSEAALSTEDRRVLADLQSELLSKPSATEVLEAYCKSRLGPKTESVHAEILKRTRKVRGFADVRKDLRLRPGESLSYRKVRLHCGAVALSVADNWFVPERLTESMNQALAESDIPFGKIVSPLGFRRKTQGTRWNSSRHARQVDRWVFENRALLIDAQQRPFSVLRERYLHSLLGH